jgi:hypothetical protein
MLSPWTALFSSRNYEAVRGDAEEVRSFQARGTGGIGQYTAVNMKRCQRHESLHAA